MRRRQLIALLGGAAAAASPFRARAQRDTSRLTEYAAELVRFAPDVIVTNGTPGTTAAEQATRSIPIVFAVVNDPVEQGLIASLAHPGGNVTGLSFVDFPLFGKSVDGKQGVEAARREKPDIILMDMGLPVMDGWEATRRIKSDDATRGVSVIGLSARTMSGDRDKAIEAGCDDYDIKPIEFDRLIGKIERLLGLGKG